MNLYKRLFDLKLNENIVISADQGLTAIPDPLVISNLIIGSDTGKSYGQNTQIIGFDNTVYTDNSIAEGDHTLAGTRSFRIISGDMSEMSWTLRSVDGLQKDMVYSVRLLNNYDMIGSITAIDANACKIYVDGMPWIIRRDENLSDEYLSGESFYRPEGDWLRGHPTNTENEYGPGCIYPPSGCFDDFDFDANTLWIIGRPDLGDISAYSTGSHSEGCQTCAQKQWSHAEGINTIAAGKYSHAEGMYCQTGYGAHAEGVSCIAARHGSHAEGYQTSCFGRYSHAAGWRTLVKTDEKRAFCWQGDTKQVYQSHGDGTFSINPAGGIDGFYIGERTLTDIIEKSPAGARELSCSIMEQFLRIAMNPTDEGLLDRAWKGNIYEMDDGKLRVFYSDLSGLSKNGTGYAFPFWHRSPEVNSNPKAHLVGILKLDERISSLDSAKAVDGPQDPSSLSILQKGFNGCYNLKYANFDGILSFSDWSFSGCNKLSSVYAPNVTHIGRRCFSNCYALSSLSLPAAADLGEEFIIGCASSFVLDFSGKTDGVIPSLHENAFVQGPQNLSVFVPADMLDEWKNAPVWKDNAQIIMTAE